MYCFCFFFFKQKTAYEMRISDWSSDVCSSDLGSTRRSLPADFDAWNRRTGGPSGRDRRSARKGASAGRAGSRRSVESGLRRDDRPPAGARVLATRNQDADIIAEDRASELVLGKVVRPIRTVEEVPRCPSLTGGGHEQRKTPRPRGGASSGRAGSVAVAARPDQREGVAAFGLDQAGIDRCRQARVVELDGAVFPAGLPGGPPPGGAELGDAGEDPDVGRAVRAEGRRVGKESVRPCRSGRAP